MGSLAGRWGQDTPSKQTFQKYLQSTQDTWPYSLLFHISCTFSLTHHLHPHPSSPGPFSSPEKEPAEVEINTGHGPGWRWWGVYSWNHFQVRSSKCEDQQHPGSGVGADDNSNFLETALCKQFTNLLEIWNQHFHNRSLSRHRKCIRASFRKKLFQLYFNTDYLTQIV